MIEPGEITVAILAGGVGSRLQAVTEGKPKVLADVGGRPFVTYLLEQLAEVSATEIVLLTGYQAEQVRRTLGTEYCGMKLAYSAEPSPLGTAGAVRWALPRFAAPTVLLLNGDSYCATDLAEFREFHCRHAADLSLVLAEAEDSGRFGAVRLEEEDRVTRFGEKQEAGPGEKINAGIYLLQRDLIEEIPAGRAISLEKEMIPAWINQGKRVHGFPDASRFIDIGTTKSYAQAESFFI